jgi:hypothetical protein
MIIQLLLRASSQPAQRKKIYIERRKSAVEMVKRKEEKKYIRNEM